MEFFIHSTTAHYSKYLLKLQETYGLAGLGFYWKAVELILLGCRKVPIDHFMILRYKPLRFFDIYDILYDSGLFEIDENFRVSLSKDADLGIDKKTVKQYFELLDSGASDNARASARDNAIADVRDSAIADARDSECVHPGPFEIDKEKTRLEKEAQAQFDRFMRRRCPHLLEMDEPFTLEQFRELKKTFTWKEIQDVLIEMENDKDVSVKKRSCYQTALSWLKHRKCKQCSFNN